MQHSSFKVREIQQPPPPQPAKVDFLGQDLPPASIGPSNAAATAHYYNQHNHLVFQPQPISHQWIQTRPMSRTAFHHLQTMSPGGGAADAGGGVCGGINVGAFLPPLNFKDERRENIFSGGVEDDALLGESTEIPHSWPPDQEDSAAIIKQPYWESLYDEERLDANNMSNKCNGSSNKEEREKLIQNKEVCNKNNSEQQILENEQMIKSKSRLFNELEAICSSSHQQQQPASSTENEGLWLTNNRCCFPMACFHHPNNKLNPDSEPDTCIGEEEKEKRISRRKRKNDDDDEELGSMGKFFEGLMRKVMDHQERLHMKFLQVIERLDQERRDREEAWRMKELEKLQREAIDRAHQQVLASRREASIVSFLEKITGKSINLPAAAASRK